MADHHVGVDDPAHGIRVERQKLPRAWPSEWHEEPIIESFAGLEAKLKETLEELGYKVHLAGERPGILSRPQRPASGGQEPDEAVLEFIRRRERGIVRYDPAQVQVERLVAEVAEAFPQQRRESWLDARTTCGGYAPAWRIAAWTPASSFRVSPNRDTSGLL